MGILAQDGKREPWFFVLILDNSLWEWKDLALFTALLLWMPENQKLKKIAIQFGKLKS